MTVAARCDRSQELIFSGQVSVGDEAIGAEFFDSRHPMRSVIREEAIALTGFLRRHDRGAELDRPSELIARRNGSRHDVSCVENTVSTHVQMDRRARRPVARADRPSDELRSLRCDAVQRLARALPAKRAAGTRPPRLPEPLCYPRGSCATVAAI
jgi:hypothetical protein